MEVLDILTKVVRVCSGIISQGAGIQGQARYDLISDLQRICSNCDTAYSTVLARLRPVKDAYQDTGELADALRSFSADQETRDAFKPYHLCGEVDFLLDKLESNLDPLKYSVDIGKVQALKRNLRFLGDYDYEIYETYDVFARQLDGLATELQSQSLDSSGERSQYVRYVIDDFESDLRSILSNLRNAKDQIL